MTKEKNIQLGTNASKSAAVESFDNAASIKPELKAKLRESVGGALKVAPPERKKTSDKKAKKK